MKDLQLPRLMFITHEVKGWPHEEQAALVCDAGIRFIQLRMKGHSFEQWKATAAKVCTACSVAGSLLIINDNVALARETGAAGVHLGKEDMDPHKARELVGNDLFIGGTANTFADVLKLKEAGVNYIGLGPFRYTDTKNKLAPVLGLEGVEEIMQQCRESGIDIPVFAIGGIKPEDTAGLLQAGVYGIAVSSAILQAGDPKETVKRFKAEIEKGLS